MTTGEPMAPPSFLEDTLMPLFKFAVLRGRASRREYWLFTLLHIGVLLVALALAVIAMTVTNDFESANIPLLGGAAIFVVLSIPQFAVSVRRLHDLDRSAVWLLVAIVPLFGAIGLFFFFMADSTQGPNRYGLDPKGRAPDPDAPPPFEMPKRFKG